MKTVWVTDRPGLVSQIRTFDIARSAALQLQAAIVIVAGIVGATPVAAQTVATQAQSAACDALKKVEFEGIQDAATQITATRVVGAEGEVPAHCHVEGYVAPNVGFVLRLPGKADWNGKFSHMAPGGYGGSREVMAPWCDVALSRGYACITQNTGHWGVSSESVWAYNNLQAEFDYGIRAANVATIAGKAIAEYFYGTAPERSYFMGCSGGGKQALVQAQRYPWNFDGIVAVEPSNPTVTGVVQLWNALATHDSEGKPLFTTADLQVLHAGAVKQCDARDGLADGIIGDARGCRFDPAVLACKAGQTSGCLSSIQIEAARKVYGGPVTSTGRKIYFPASVGGEMGSYFTGGSTGLDYKTQYWRYMGFTPDPGPSWMPKDFNFDVDWKRSMMKDAVLVASDNPDLRKLRTEGHKLMIIQGEEDSGLPGPLVTMDYYEMVEKILGGRVEAQKSARLFVIPGRSHCVGGVGAAAVDMFGAIESWVEQGQAPDMIIGAHMEGTLGNPAMGLSSDFIRLPKDLSSAKFTRPHYPYPLRARYKGKGDPNDYRSFEAVGPDSK
ncbi:MAG: feruloyl esterase [Steroidobacteraceae bacterium]